MIINADTLLTSLIGLLLSNLVMGQSSSGAPRRQESATYWVAQGHQLTNSGQHARAYSAFQLARSLGAPDMVSMMELARRRGIQQIQLQALLAQAQGLAETDPVQGLRLLEHAHRYFPDSSRILQQIGAIVNQPNGWLYQLKTAGIWGSPQLRYLVANNPMGLLYERQADSLVVRYALNQPVIRTFFSPNERYAWIVTDQESLLVDCRGRLVAQTRAGLTAAVFSPDNRYALLTYSDEPIARLWQLTSGKIIATNVTQSIRVTDHVTPFSPDGRYVQMLSAEGSTLWRLTDAGPQRLASFTGANLFKRLVFSPVGPYFVGIAAIGRAVAVGRLEPDTVQLIRRFQHCNSLLLTPPFSPDGRWLLLTFQDPKVDSLWTVTPTDLLPHSTFPYSSAHQASLRVVSRFSPDGTQLLRSSSVPGDAGNAQLWRLTTKEARLLHQFQQKATIMDDVFSPDSRYLLSQHTSAIGDSLWRLTEEGLQPVFGFRAMIRHSAPPLVGTSGSIGVTSPFSPDGQILLAFHEGATPDSLWLITKTGLQPLHGFRDRLTPATTYFSVDSRYLLGGQVGSTIGTLWSVSTLDIPRRLQFLRPVRDALFSAAGTQLLCQLETVADSTELYHNVGGVFRRQQVLAEPFRLADCRFFAHDRYLFSSGRSNTLWRLTPSGLEPLHQFQQPLTSRRFLLGGTRTEQLQFGWTSSPDGRYFITHSYGTQSLPDSLWFLTNDNLLGVQGANLRLAGRFSSTGLDGGNSRYEFPQVMLAGREPMLWGLTTDSSSVLYQLQRQTAIPVKPPELHQTLLGYSSESGYGLFAPTSKVGPGRLWQYRARRWQYRQTLPTVREAFADDWPDKTRINLISPDGHLLLIPGADNQLRLFRLTTHGATLMVQVTASIRSFAFLPVQPNGHQPVGVLYSTSEQTYLLSVLGRQSRRINLGAGTLRKAPVFQGRWAYLARRQIDGQTTIDMLDWTTGTLMSSTVVRNFLDMSVAADGTIWTITTTGLTPLYHPMERLRWLTQAPVKALTSTLRQQYPFD